VQCGREKHVIGFGQKEAFLNMATKRTSSNAPPDGLPTYRLLTGPDDAAFCRRVSEALAIGYKLYGSPSATFDGKDVIVAQVIIWPSIEGAIARSK
jgi:hypothetical protein